MSLHGPWLIPTAKPGGMAATGLFSCSDEFRFPFFFFPSRMTRFHFFCGGRSAQETEGLKKLSFLLLPRWRHRKQTFRADSHIPGHPVIPHTLSNSQLRVQAAFSENCCGKVENWEVRYVMSCSYTQQSIC